MSASNSSRELHGRVTFLDGRGNLPLLEITTPSSTAEIYLRGATVTHFQKAGEPPALFLSQCSRFEPGAPIRGGIPVIFPWFGKPSDKPGQHGFARVKDWEVKEIISPPDGSVTVRLGLVDCDDAPECPPCLVEYVVTINATLTVELIVTNQSAAEFTFENCLHTYFAVADIHATTVTGLRGVEYLDALDGFARKREAEDAIHFTAETDRVYFDTPHTTEIQDRTLGRRIRVEKENSLSTVVWNPWIAKAKAMADFGDDEYQRMVCVESGNVALNRLTLPVGQTARLKIHLSTAPLT